MALINCPECNRKISDKAVACPHCGLPSAFFAVATEKNTKEINSIEFKSMLDQFDYDYAGLFLKNQYLPISKVEHFIHDYAKYIELLQDPLILQYLHTNAENLSIEIDRLDHFLNKINTLDQVREANNEKFLSSKLMEYKGYFDEILKDVDPNIILDEEQRRAVLTDENHCLLVAGAGAGKTTTMAAKVKYLVDKQGINPKDIIVISYTNKAIDELKERINKRLNIPAKISTFHAFAYDIIRNSSSEQPVVNFSAYQIIYQMLEKSVYKSSSLMRKLILFLGYYFDLPEEAFQFKSLNEYHMYKASIDYETLKSGLGEYIKQIWNQRSKSKKTITGEYLRSLQEVQIANFLYLNGIDYEYEKPYPYRIADSKKLYTPDFYISQGEHSAYIEYYGIIAGYKKNLYTQEAIKMYKSRILDKRRLHRKFGTELIEIWPQYEDQRLLLDHLSQELKNHGFVLKPRDDKTIYQKIVDTGKDKYIYKFIFFLMEFIEQYKTLGLNEGGFAVLRNKTDNPRNLLFLEIAEEVYHHYQETLKQNNQIDFADMINDAYLLLCEIEKTGAKLPYQYIVIDEFQDIARQRFNLTKQLAAVSEAKVVAVGDDWQSIYAFAGSDITLFTKFLELMGSGVELKITHTYRNSQELINIAGDFIQKNTTQIKKKLVSPKKLEEPIRIEFYEDKKQPYQNSASAVVKAIGKIVSEFGTDSSILLIGRYNFDLYKLCQMPDFEAIDKERIKCNAYPKAKITFMTAHSSKGLGYDNVIILNMLESKYGFPCQIEDDPIMKMVRYEDTSIPYAEERRLFYVALTRTKNRVYIIAPLHKPSRFLVEIIQDNQIPYPKEFNTEVVDLFSIRCPICQFPLKYEYNKNYGLGLYICTNEVEICDFMTNDKTVKADIFKCPKCEDGYMIVKKNRENENAFYGCTNYNVEGINCTHVEQIGQVEQRIT